MKALSCWASKSARSRYRRGLSRYGFPAVGQKVAQLPHSLQKSVSTATCRRCSTRNGDGRPPPRTSPAATRSDGRSIAIGSRGVGEDGQVGADPHADAAEAVAVQAAARLGPGLLLGVGEGGLVEPAPQGERGVPHRHPPLAMRPPPQQPGQVVGRPMRRLRRPGPGDDRRRRPLAVGGGPHDGRRAVGGHVARRRTPRAARSPASPGRRPGSPRGSVPAAARRRSRRRRAGSPPAAGCRRATRTRSPPPPPAPCGRRRRAPPGTPCGCTPPRPGGPSSARRRTGRDSSSTATPSSSMARTSSRSAGIWSMVRR